VTTSAFNFEKSRGEGAARGMTRGTVNRPRIEEEKKENRKKNSNEYINNMEYTKEN